VAGRHYSNGQVLNLWPPNKYVLHHYVEDPNHSNMATSQMYQQPHVSSNNSTAATEKNGHPLTETSILAQQGAAILTILENQYP
jgi:hypothetical protein